MQGNDQQPSRRQAWVASLGYTESPTMRYTPVQGEKLADRMTTATPETAILQL